jgi:RimJ/RimL family protein N-acetyltransferase
MPHLAEPTPLVRDSFIEAARHLRDEGWLPDFPVDEVAAIIVRHRLTPELTRHGGHIGYHVAPRHRRQGHATAMLAGAIGHSRDSLGLTRLLLTCAEPNLASRRVIEANGGVLDNILEGECRYWIDQPAGPAASNARPAGVATGPVLNRPMLPSDGVACSPNQA